jgi:phosphoribosylformylglycinamidine synthase
MVKEGVATSVGHSPCAAIDPVAGGKASNRRGIYQSFGHLSKMVLDGITLSANWMWACKTEVKMLVCCSRESCSTLQ